MKVPEFKLERFFAHWEFVASHLLCSSDPESYRLEDLLALAGSESRRFWDNLALGYTECAGHPLLRAEIAGLYQDVKPDEILTFSGAEEAVFILMSVLLGPGDHAIVTWPGYQSLYELAKVSGADVTILPLEPFNAWTFNLDVLKQALRPTTKLIVVNFPHNPTGMLPDHNIYLALIELAEKANAYLFSDEVYRFLEYNSADRLPAAVECSDRAISLGSMSKVFGMAGLRIGWLATHDTSILRDLTTFKDYTSTCNSATSEILALIACRAKETIVARNLEIISRNLVYLDQFFDRWAGVFEWTRPRAGCVAFPRLCSDLHIEQFVTELVEQRGVLLLPGTIFDFHGNHFRIGFGRINLPEALAYLEDFTAKRLGISPMRV